MMPENEKEIRQRHELALAKDNCLLRMMTDAEADRGDLLSLLDAETARAEAAEKQSKEEHKAALKFRAKMVKAESQANRYLEAKQRLQVECNEARAKLADALAER